MAVPPFVGYLLQAFDATATAPLPAPPTPRQVYRAPLRVGARV